MQPCHASSGTWPRAGLFLKVTVAWLYLVLVHTMCSFSAFFEPLQHAYHRSMCHVHTTTLVSKCMQFVVFCNKKKHDNIVAWTGHTRCPWKLMSLCIKAPWNTHENWCKPVSLQVESARLFHSIFAHCVNEALAKSMKARQNVEVL